jgi:hypothetical protein
MVNRILNTRLDAEPGDRFSWHMNDLAWLVGHSFPSLTRREFDWLLVFEKDVTLVIECLWRLVEDGRIRFTSLDDGQWFGLPAPVDAAAEVNLRLEGASVEAVQLRQGILDLELRFNTGHVLQLFPDSSGYEAWRVSAGSRLFHAVGEGELYIWGEEPSGS